MSLPAKALSLLLRPLGRKRPAPNDPRTIFVLRNNDLGDLLVITPVFAALKKAFPQARILAGVGDWAAPILRGNPNIDAIVPVNAPWHNKAICRHSPNSAVGFFEALKYIAFSPEVAALRKEKADIGIDILGSPQGTLLLTRAGIRYRVGVHGYAGGDTGCQAWVEHHSKQQVVGQALAQAEIIGAKPPAEIKPEIYLTDEERAAAEARWLRAERRLVVAPGAGIPEKRWPLERFAELATEAIQDGWQVAVIGGPDDRKAGQRIAEATGGLALNLAGELSLRESCALVATAQALICNSSVAMHVGAAFAVPTLVLLGPLFESAVAHTRQWGWENTLILGPEPGGRGIASTTEAFIILGMLGQMR